MESTIVSKLSKDVKYKQTSGVLHDKVGNKLGLDGKRPYGLAEVHGPKDVVSQDQQKLGSSFT